MRHGNQTIMYDDTMDTPAPNKTTPLENTPPPSAYQKKMVKQLLNTVRTPTFRDLVELQEHFQKLQEWLTQLEPTSNQPAHVEELAHLTS